MSQVNALCPYIVGKPASSLKDLALLARSGRTLPLSVKKAYRQVRFLTAVATVSFGLTSGLALAGVMGRFWALPLSLLSLGVTVLTLSRGLRLLLVPSPSKPTPLAEEIALEEEVCAIVYRQAKEAMVLLNEVWVPVAGSVARCGQVIVGSPGVVLLVSRPLHGRFTVGVTGWCDSQGRVLPSHDLEALELQRVLTLLITHWAGKLHILRPELVNLMVHAAVIISDDAVVDGPTVVPVLRVGEIPHWLETLPPAGGWALQWQFLRAAARLVYELRRLTILHPPVACLSRN